MRAEFYLDGYAYAGGIARELGEAVLVLELEAIFDVVQRIQTQTPEAAQHLQSLVEEFQMDQTREFLVETEDKKQDDRTRDIPIIFVCALQKSTN